MWPNETSSDLNVVLQKHTNICLVCILSRELDQSAWVVWSYTSLNPIRVQWIHHLVGNNFLASSETTVMSLLSSALCVDLFPVLVLFEKQRWPFTVSSLSSDVRSDLTLETLNQSVRLSCCCEWSVWLPADSRILQVNNTAGRLQRETSSRSCWSLLTRLNLWDEPVCVKGWLNIWFK